MTAADRIDELRALIRTADDQYYNRGHSDWTDAEYDQWFVELLVPWSSVSKRESAGEHRTVSIYASRFLFSRNERYACPGIALESAAFLSDFRRIDIAQFESGANFAPLLHVEWHL